VSQLVLSLFPGIGLLDMAFEEAGFCVVRGPDLLWGGDIHRLHPPAGRFDGVIGGPPCQRFSRLAHMVVHRYGEGCLAENLIPEFERVVVEAQPDWFVMENVPDAPVPAVPGYTVAPVILNARWFGEDGVGSEQTRTRRFSFGLRGERQLTPWRYLDLAVLENPVFEYAVVGKWGGLKKNGRGYDKPEHSIRKGYNAARRSIQKIAELQGLPPDFLADAPFTQHAKRQVIANGVPLPLGRAVARVIVKYLAEQERECAA